MYSVQRGVIPTIAGIISAILPVWPLILDLKYIFENINTRIPEIMGDSQKPIWLVVVGVVFFTMFFPVFFGMLLAGIFPAIKIQHDGIKFIYWLVLGSMVKWDEIESLVYYPNGYVVLRINKLGLPFFNGQYFNLLHARVIGSQLPILIFSPGLEKKEEIIGEILKKSSARVVHKKE